MTPYIRQLNVGDAKDYRAIRLEALKAFPQAYGATYAQTLKQPIGAFNQTLEQAVLFGAFDGEELCGIVCFVACEGAQDNHIGHLYQMFVKSSVQGNGIGLALIKQLFEYAGPIVRQVHLGVGTNNHSALALYKKAGFETYGTEPRALCVSGTYIDEYLMVKFLDSKDS